MPEATASDSFTQIPVTIPYSVQTSYSPILNVPRMFFLFQIISRIYAKLNPLLDHDPAQRWLEGSLPFAIRRLFGHLVTDRIPSERDCDS